MLISLLAPSGVASPIPIGWHIDYDQGNNITPVSNSGSKEVSIGFEFPFYGEANHLTSTAWLQYSGYLGLGEEAVDNLDLTDSENWPYES